MKKLLLSVAVLSAAGAYAQNEPAVKTEKAVGIETSQPRATLDVNGDARLQKVELMTTSIPTTEIFPDCPCVLTIDKFGVIHRIPKDQFVLAGGSTSGGNQGGGNQGGGNQGGGSQGGGNVAQIGGNASAETIDDATNYVVSLIYNTTQIQGKIDDSTNKIRVIIPYRGGNGQTYQSVTVTAQTEAGAMQDDPSARKAIKMKVLGGRMEDDGVITAEISTFEDFKVKMLPPDGVPLKIAEFKLKVGEQTKTITLNAIGGIPDKLYGKMTNGELEHQFIYEPVQGPDGKIWLNNNLGATYARVNDPVDGSFNPTRQATSAGDELAFGSLFQWGREANDGYELINWKESKSSSEPKYKNKPWFDKSQLTKDNWNPCPSGYRLPTEDELDLLVGYSKYVFAYDTLLATTLALPLTAWRNSTRDIAWSVLGESGWIWSSSTWGPEQSQGLWMSDRGRRFARIYEDRDKGLSVRCYKNGQ